MDGSGGRSMRGHRGRRGRRQERRTGREPDRRAERRAEREPDRRAERRAEQDPVRRPERRRGRAGSRGKRRWRLILPLLLFLAGASVALYPLVTDLAYRREVREERTRFEAQVREQEKEEPFEELYRELRRRNEELYRNHQKNLTDPWSYEQPSIDLTEYGLEGNVIGFLSIPAMEIELPILLGANEENMKLGAVHLTETSYPVGGENTNCVIAAHRGYSRAAMFRDIELLEPGDRVRIENFRETLDYEVKEIRVISPTDIDQVLIQERRDLVTLITCHHYGHNDQRYVVFCERCRQ